MSWFKCIGLGGGGQGGLSDLYVNPYNVENGSYAISNNTIEYTVSAQTGYEGMSVQLLGLEVGHQYLISFDAELMNAPTSWAGSYSWKTCIADGNITDYGAGDYGRDTLSEGQYGLPTTATKKSYGFLVTPQSAMTTLLFLTARASTGQNVVFIINNFKMADIAGGSGGITAPTKFWQGIQDEYDALQSYDNDTMYVIVARYNQKTNSGSYGNFMNKAYIGSKQVFPFEEQGYDWVIRDYVLPDDNVPTSGNNYDYDVNIGINLQDSSNVGRDWQIEFKATLSTGSYSSSDQVIFGQGNNSSAVLKEVYFNTSGDLYIYGKNISDAKYIDDANGHDIKMVYSSTNQTIELYKDGTLINTFNNITYSASNYELGINRYNGNYRFHGTINYLKFKWLS